MKLMKWRFTIFVMAVLFASCSGGGMGCSGCAKSCGGNPNYKFSGTPIKNSIQTRLTQSGFDFITKQIKPIIEATLKKSGQTLACTGSGMVFPTQSFGNGPRDSKGNAQAPSGNTCTTKVGGFPLKASCSGKNPNKTWFYSALKQSSLCGAWRQNLSKYS